MAKTGVLTTKNLSVRNSELRMCSTTAVAPVVHGSGFKCSGPLAADVEFVHALHSSDHTLI